MPSEDILKKYADIGGKLVTFGSDAHSAVRYCEKITKVEEIIKKYGFIPIG